jgi:aminoglycoside phosphotransferase (APT) family kinase protein
VTIASLEVALEDALAEALVPHCGEGVRIERLERLTGGASRESWAFDAVDRDGRRHPLVLRRDFAARAGGEVPWEEGIDRATELELQHVLHAAGVPVPRPLFAPDTGLGLESCFVMERVEGESRPRALARKDELGDLRARMLPELGAALARIHTLDVEGLPPLPQSPAKAQLELCRRMLDLAPRPRPVLELALRWLAGQEAELPRRAQLVHGDFRNGNFIATQEGLRAVIDWEYAHLGDPLEDIGFLCMRAWRFGADEREVGGIGDRAELYSAYAGAGGEPVEPERVRFWEVAGNLKWGALCQLRALEHIEGRQRSVELAAIGRRVSETELDLLELLDAG